MKHGYQVDVLYVRLYSSRSFFKCRTHIEAYEQDGIRVFSTGVVHIKSAEKITTFFYLNALRRLYHDYIQKNPKPDVIESHFSQFAGYGASIISREEQIPLISIEHAGWYLRKIKRYQKDKLRSVIQQCDRLICVSDALRRSIISQISGIKQEKVVVLPNMLDEVFHYYDLPSDKTDFVFFSAGNLTRSKRIDMLIDAFCDTFRETDHVKLLIAGEGEQRETLEALIEKKKRKDQVALLGSLHKTSMLEQYRCSNCFVLPSEHETFGIVYREAMAVGRPIITTAHQGFQDDWSDRWGIRIDIDDKAQLVSALKKMYLDYSSYDRKLISYECLTKYGEEQVIGAYIALLSIAEKEKTTT